MTPPNKTDPETACQRCGSSHFQLAEFAQYIVFSGGGYQILSKYSRQAVVCLCGQPISIKKLNLLNKDDRSFGDSLILAQEYRARTGPNRLMGDLTRDFITHTDFQALSDQVSALETILQQLSKNDQKDDKKRPL